MPPCAVSKLWLLLPPALKGEQTACHISKADSGHNRVFVVHYSEIECVRLCMCIFSAALMQLPLSPLHPHSLATLSISLFPPPPFCLSSLPRTRNPSRTAMVALGVSNLCFMLPWQFAQFVLLTQVKREQREALRDSVGRKETGQRD